MIYTVTFNPSVDYIISVNHFEFQKTNRTKSELILPGGKGINVTTVLNNLGLKSTALGFVAGFTGEEIEKRLHNAGISTEFIHLKQGYSRINVKLTNDGGTEINGSGPTIEQHDIDKLMRRLADLEIGDTLVLAGTIPSSIPDTIYSDIMQQLANKQIDFVVDATNELLLNVLKYRPFLIKPNNHELEEIFSVNLESKKDVIPFAKKLQEKGARNVLVSLAGEGAVLLDELGHVYISSAPSGKLINAVGAGDSMVAGFLAGYKEDNNYMHAFMMGLASGSASAFSPVFATKSEVLNVYQQIMSPDFDIHEIY